MTYRLDIVRRPFGPGDLKPLLEQSSISRTVVVQTVSTVRETVEFLALAAEHEFIAGVVGWVDLMDRAVARTIGQLQSAPAGDRLVSIRHQVEDEADPDWLLQPDVQRGIAAVGHAGLAFDLLVRTRQLTAATETVRRNPDVQFVLDHCAKPNIGEKPDRPWKDAMSRLAELPNVACKISGLVTEADWSSWTVEEVAPYIDLVIEWFGRERCMFGSDWPVCLLAAQYDQVVDLVRDVAGEDEEIFGRTAERVYGL
jgi:L-fuconolactonase